MFMLKNGSVINLRKSTRYVSNGPLLPTKSYTVNYYIGYVNEDFTMSFRKSSYIFSIKHSFQDSKTN